MRHYRIPVAIAVGLATALAAGATGVAKTTPAVSAKPAAADTAAKLMAEHRGGTLKLLAKAAGGSLDPQVNYTLEYWQLYRATQDGLVTFKAAGGDAAFEIVPDLAVAIPKPTDGGKTWKFQLRKGIKYSNGKPVTPQDVLYTFERIFKVHTPTAGGFYSVHRGRRQVPQDARHVRSLEVHRGRREDQQRHVPPRRSRTPSGSTSSPCRTRRCCPSGRPTRISAPSSRPAPAPTRSRSTTRTTS